MNHYLGRGKAALGFGAGHFRTLVSMATDSVIMGKRHHRVFSTVLDRIIFILADSDDIQELG